MKKIGFAILGIITVAALTVPVLAEDAAAPKAEKHAKGEKGERCKKADANADGKLSLEEFKTICKKGDAEAKFTAADADKDGFLTKDEMKAAHGKGKGHGKGEGKGGEKTEKEAAK
jgi:hypothetical protein